MPELVQSGIVWIRLSDQIPDYYENVLILFRVPKTADDEDEMWVIGCGYLHEDYNEWTVHTEYHEGRRDIGDDRLRIKRERVSHWMPYPDPPKGMEADPEEEIR